MDSSSLRILEKMTQLLSPYMIAHLKKLGLREPPNQHKHDTQFLPSFSFFSGPTTKGKSHLNEGIKD